MKYDGREIGAIAKPGRLRALATVARAAGRPEVAAACVLQAHMIECERRERRSARQRRRGLL